MRPLRYAINVTLDGCCDHRAILPDEEMQAFHQDEAGRMQLRYYSQVVAHAGAFAVPLLEAIIAQLETACAPEERQRLCVLKKSLVWQRTLGGARL